MLSIQYVHRSLVGKAVPELQRQAEENRTRMLPHRRHPFRHIHDCGRY